MTILIFGVMESDAGPQTCPKATAAASASKQQSEARTNGNGPKRGAHLLFKDMGRA